MKTNLKSRLGQNTAEYLILLVLVAVGSIGVFSIFGGTLKRQVTNVVSAITGVAPTADTSNLATQANNLAKSGTSLDIHDNSKNSDIKKFDDTGSGTGGAATPTGNR